MSHLHNHPSARGAMHHQIETIEWQHKTQKVAPSCTMRTMHALCSNPPQVASGSKC